MAPTKQRSTGKKYTVNSKKSKAKLAIMKRWNNRSSESVKPTNPTLSCEVEAPTSQNETSNSKVETDEQQDLYSNIRKQDLVSSNVELGLDECFEAAPEYLIVDKRNLSQLFEKLVCPNCNISGLKLGVTKKCGFNSKLTVECENCADSLTSVSSSHQIPNDTEYDINRRITKAFLSISKGYAALEQFSMVMNMDCMSKDLFHKCSVRVQKLGKVAGIESLKKARARVREYCRRENNELTEESVIDLAVSFDGSWHKRGFTSNYGVGSVIHIDTGLVIDYCVLSKFCRNCAITENALGEDSPEFNMWYQGHVLDCDKNYDGSSPGMEVAAAEILWKRSIAYKFRYTTIVSDGDSKVFVHLQSLNIYDRELKKEECINHVSKRLGTALRNEIKACKAKKITLGGKAHGSLKDSTIKKLTRYYHNAIFSNINKDVVSVKNSILATLHHCSSTDESPRHSKCPTGEDSWCFYNRALANEEVPGRHAENIKTPLNKLVLENIAPIYKRLTDATLLEKCLKGQTQNANESLHSFIWRKCDKTRSVSRRLVELAVAEGVSEYNFGNTAFISTLHKTKISPGRKSIVMANVRDQRRKVKINRAKSDRLKRRRNYLRMRNIQSEERKKEQEGSLYGAGEF